MSINPFYRLAPFIQDYIYTNKWIELREVQVEACRVIFDTDSNLLLSSGTASGKTEAAFLPVLTQLYEKNSASVGVLYISPLKALINDQFYRLNGLLEEACIPVHKWHGDVSQNDKNKLLKNPQGVLQITPESLEGMLMNKKQEIMHLFWDLKFIIIDEVHNFMGCDRGIQLLCILERIQRLIGNIPRRIGLSATLGNYVLAEEWLNSGTNRTTLTPKMSKSHQKIKLAVEHFWLPQEKNNQKEKNDTLQEAGAIEKFTPYYEFIYTNTFGKRCIIFGNTKSELEDIIATLKQMAEKFKTNDIYYIHHGNISATLREEAENAMKTSDTPIVTGATVTLELGVDIGALERIMQLDSPHSVSSFLQRLGRTGRRGTPSEMWFACKEYEHNADESIVQQVNWNFIQCLAIIQLYLEERWIEPLYIPKYPFGLVYHQTMSVMASIGETSPSHLAQTVLSMNSFKNISQDDYKKLLMYLIEIEHLELSERRGLQIGLKGEKEINTYKFYAVFDTYDEFSVRNESFEIGTLQFKIPIGERFALAGKTWEVSELDEKNRLIFVKHVKGKSKIIWLSPGTIIHTKVLKKMKEILNSNEAYKYLQTNAMKRLQEIRTFATETRIKKKTVINTGGNNYCIFAWLGTRAATTLQYSLNQYGIEVKQSDRFWIVVNTTKTEEEILEILNEIKIKSIDKYSLIQADAEIIGKFNQYIPKELLKKQYIEDFLDVEEMQTYLNISS